MTRVAELSGERLGEGPDTGLDAGPTRKLGTGQEAHLRTGRMLLALGMALRVVVFCVLLPLNNDAGHFDVIRYIVEHRALPAAMENAQSYQPPLYYLLAA